MWAGAEPLQDDRRLLIEIDPVHLRAWRHQRAHGTVAQLQHARDHARLLRLDGACTLPLGDEHPDLRLGDPLLRLLVAPEQAQDQS